MEKFVIEWQSPEFEYREKGVSWYWLSVIVAVIILSVSVWQKNFLFAFFVVVAEILVLVWAGRNPKMVSFNMDEKGLTIGHRKFYPYSAIEMFGIRESSEDNLHELAIRFKHGLHAWLKIRIPAKRSNEIEKVISRYAPKTEPEDSFLDSLEKLIGF